MSNNKDLFESLHQQHHPMVKQMCMGFMKGDLAMANDLSQEVFINIWRALDKFRGASSHKTWIYRVTVNTCLKHIGKNKARNQIPFGELEQELPSVDNESENTENHHLALYRAIGQLKELDRLIIMMVLDDLKYTEIANVIGLSEGNLRVKIHRIKATLKNILENE
ncbi:MAG: RNA polymerase sigma factor [Cyclobacteriaceae bacterium]